jgi:multidrug efflux pump subunit AcrA (membrane-fusion protein)
MKSQVDNQKQGPSIEPGQAVVPERSPTRGRRTYWLIGLAVVAVIGTTAAMKIKRADPAASTGGTFAARRGDLTITVTEAGSIRARKSINYNCEVARRGGELTILSIVPAGTYITQEDVNSGKVLVELDSSALREQLTRSRLDLATEQGNMISAKEANDIQVIQNESDIAGAQLKVRFALMALQKYLGTRLAEMLTRDVKHNTRLTEHVAPFLQKVKDDPNLLDGSAAGQELKKFNDDIVLAQGALKTAQATLVGTEQLHDANYVSDLDLQRDRLTVVNRQFAHENGTVSLDLFLQYDFPKNAEQYLSDYVEAQRALDRTYAQCRSRLAQAQAKLSDANEHVVEETGAVKWYEELVAKCTMRAKAPGLVIYGTGTSSDAYTAIRGRDGGGASSGIIAPGEKVYQGQTLISMPDTASMVAEIAVHETEVDKIRPGQAAQIILDAFPDQVLHGQVYEVAPLPDEQRGFMNPDLKVYKTLVSIDGTHDFLKTRMSCKVEIFIRQLKDAVLVPIQVVANRRGKKVLYVTDARGAVREREVKTGAFNATFVQIVEGLGEGEEVLLNPPLFTESAEPAAFQPGQSEKAVEPNAPAGPATESPSQTRVQRVIRLFDGRIAKEEFNGR